MVVAKVIKRCYCRGGTHGRGLEYEQTESEQMALGTGIPVKRLLCVYT